MSPDWTAGDGFWLAQHYGETVDDASREEIMAKKSRGAVNLGRRGGQARAASMSAQERSDAARRAALAGREKLSAKERSAAAKRAADARWNGHQKGRKKA